MLPSVAQEVNDDVVVDKDTILFMDDTTSWKALDVHNHISGIKIGNIPKKIDLVKDFAENKKMELNPQKCKEMLIDFRKDIIVISAIKINDCVLESVSLHFGNQINPGIWGPNLAWEFERGTIQGHRANLKAWNENNMPWKDL